jgi:hypothetical protein
MSFAEKLLYCINCKKNFTFTVKEQESRSSRGYPNDPWRCLPCRQARKPQSTQSDSSTEIRHHSDSYFR